MNRIRGGAAALGLALLLFGNAALAQEISGRLTGRVADLDTGIPLAGVTVIVQGPQGEDATLTDQRGDYNFTSLPIGTYVIRFYAANSPVQVEQPGVIVTAEKTVRVNAKIAANLQAAAQQTYVITGKAPSIDVGSARVGVQFDNDYTQNVPLGRTFGDVIERAPGAFVDGSGNVAIGGATGLENIYLVNGMNVTGIRFGNLESGLGSTGGGSNLPLEFLNQIDVSSGGYQAEYGGAMGGVVNTVLKSGTNEWHGSVFGYWSPYGLSASPTVVQPIGSSLAGVRKPDFDDSFGVEVGGPLIKDKLFLWVGFAPRITDTHVLRLTYAEQEGINPQTGMATGSAALDANGNPITRLLPDWTARIPESHRTYYYAANIDYVPDADNKLTLSLVGTPSFNKELKNQYQVNAYDADPSTAVESLTKVNTDISAHWTSKFFNRHFQLDVLAGMHNEYFYDRSPYSQLNSTNELQYYGANLWDLEHAQGCQPDTATGFQPCPISPAYYGGGFGEIDKYNAYRWTGEVKLTNVFEAGGRHELKYGWHLEYATFDLTRSYSGTDGDRAFVTLNPGSTGPGGFIPWTFFTLPPGEQPIQYSSGSSPTSNLYGSPYYQDAERATVASLSNAFFLQDSYSPAKLRNLTINAGLRMELQKLYDNNGAAFLNTDNLAPRVSAVYDPFNDGRSKLSVSYGRYYEAVPLDVAARWFSGQNFVQGFGDLSTCPGSLQNAYNWTGAGDYTKCGTPPAGLPTFNSEYAQKNLQGQYHNEIVATAEREVLPDTTVRLDYQHRWIGNVIEDGYGPGFANGVLANPGNVPQSAIDAANAEIAAAQKAAATAAPANQAAAQAAVAAAQYNLGALQTLAAAPKPERTYDALTLSLNHRFSRNWFARATYTYSRLVGNYEGLYQAETSNIAPNGSNAYDAPELNVNQFGRLPNDRPHLFHLDGFYRHDVGRGHVTLGLTFTARSGMPRNYIGNLEPNSPYQIVFLLPRGDAGRTPTVTELDGKIAYGRPLGAKMNIEGFIDLFNILNQQTPILTDDNYTFDAAPPIVNGTAQDLKYAKNVAGQPITKNPNFGQPLAYQTPFNARLGLRLNF
ncbi:MAG TPA: TonB-dependent receptor [Polyangia bacterium]|nr:TonB-dependent receptor [Polyangia bacterium]